MSNNWGGVRPGAGAKKKTAIIQNDVKKPPAEPRRELALSPSFVEQIIRDSAAHARSTSRAPEMNPFQLPAFPPKAMPPEKLRMAMDESMSWGEGQWASGFLNQVAAEGLLFLGYPFLSELAQRPEYRIISETIADDATRKWIDFEVTGDEEENRRRAERDPAGEAERMADPDERKKRVAAAGKTDKVKALKDDQERLEVRDRYYKVSVLDGFFGRSHLYHDFGQALDGDPKELSSSVGSGRDALSKAKVGKGSLNRLQVVEPVWTYPMTYNAINPLKADWYNPQFWYVMGKEIHCSRIPAFIGHPVPDMLKPAYAFGGLSLSQMAKPVVDIWLTTRQSVAELIHSFSVMVLMTDLQTILQPGNANGLLARAALFNALRDNQGLMVVNKATEDFKNVSASLSGLHELQAQAQEHVASIARIPLVKYTGIAPSGLNASSEGEINVYDDTIAAYQNRFIRPNLTRTINFEQLSLFGEVDPEITFVFEPLRQMTEKERGEKQKAEAERDSIYVDMGAIAPEEVRQRVVDDPELPYASLDPEDVPDLSQEEEQGLMPGGKKPGEGGSGGDGGGSEGGEGGGQDRAIVPFGGAADEAAFNEADHPRAPDGKFGSGGGSGGGERQHLRMPQYGLTERPRFSFSEWRASLRPKPKSSGDPQSAEGVVVFGAGEPSDVKEIGGVPFKAWEPPDDWAEVDGQANVDEPEIPEIPDGMELSSGLLIREKDGRVWMMRPKGGYGGYHQTFPKGRAEEGLTLQANAIKEAFEETGLKARVVGFAGDFEGDTTVTRFYVAERESGDPAQAGEESEGVILAPPGKLKDFLNRERDRKIAHAVVGDEAGFEESKHPRDKDGKFATGSGGGSGPSNQEKIINAATMYGVGSSQHKQAVKQFGSKATTAHEPHDPISKLPPLNFGALKQVGPQMGSNPGGVYEGVGSEKFYVKEAQSPAHVENELLAAKLFALTGSPTLKYHEVFGGSHVATELQKLDKKNVKDLSPEERKKAQDDFVTQAWLANYDAAGTGGDNIGTAGGQVLPLDFGGALEYRAQGKPKGDAFGNHVDELKTMLDPEKAPDAAKLYGEMTDEQMKASAQKVVNISDYEIGDTVASMGMGTTKTDALIAKLIARKNDIAKIFNIEFEGKHARGPGGKFAAMGGSEEPPKFKTKKEQAAHLLSKGVTTQEMLKALNWPSISMPAMAKSLGMTLEKVKEGGVTKYIGTPMTSAAKGEAAMAAAKAKESAKLAAVQSSKQTSVAPTTPTAKATPAELEKAKKTVPLKLQYVPGAPQGSVEAQNLVDKFNEKYAEKPAKTPAELEQKVADFKEMQAAMVPLMTAEQQKAAAAAKEQAENQAKAAAEAAEKAKAQAKKQKAEAEKMAKEAAAKNKEIIDALGISDVEALGFAALAKMIGGKQTDVINSFKSYEEQAKSYGYPITGFQCALIKNYTDGGYHSINAALRTGVTWTSAQQTYVKLLNKALKSMPTYSGVTKRGTQLDTAKQQDYVVGNVVEERAFTSTSPSKPWGGNTKFTITAIGKRGAHVKKLSSHGSEDEVVFSARTFFHVDKVEGKPGGQMHVHMTEIEHE